MLKICDDADKVLQQLNVTIASYDSLMKQLEVDISMVESEKKNVTEPKAQSRPCPCSSTAASQAPCRCFPYLCRFFL